MASTTTPAGQSDYLQQLVTIREDPQVKDLARRRAGDPDVAQDALQETYYAMACIVDCSVAGMGDCAVCWPAAAREAAETAEPDEASWPSVTAVSAA